MEWLCGGAGFELRKSVCSAPGINAELPHVVNDAAPSCFLQGPLYHARHLIKCQVDRLSNATPLLGNPCHDLAAFSAGHISSHMIFFLFFKCKSRVFFIPLMFRIDLETKDVLRSWG